MNHISHTILPTDFILGKCTTSKGAFNGPADDDLFDQGNRTKSIIKVKFKFSTKKC